MEIGSIKLDVATGQLHESLAHFHGRFVYFDRDLSLPGNQATPFIWFPSNDSAASRSLEMLLVAVSTYTSPDLAAKSIDAHQPVDPPDTEEHSKHNQPAALTVVLQCLAVPLRSLNQRKANQTWTKTRGDDCTVLGLSRETAGS